MNPILIDLLAAAALCLSAPVYADGYTVTIPAEVNVDTTTGTGTLTVTADLDGQQTVTVGIKSENNYNLKCGDTYLLGYSLTANDFKDGKLTYTADESNNNKGSFTSKLDIALADNATPQVSGTYQDILTFDISSTYQPAKNDPIYSVTFDATGGTTDITEKKLTAGADLGTMPTPTKPGYTFEGWFDAATGGNKVDASTTMGSADRTLYAYWTEHVLTIRYHSGGAQRWNKFSGGGEINITKADEIVETETVGYDEVYDHASWGLLDVARLTRTGYKPINVWKINSAADDAPTVSGLGKEHDGNVYNPNAPIGAGDTGKVVAEALGFLSKLEQNDVTVDLYPTFEAIKYTVLYRINTSDSNAEKAVPYTYDEEWTFPTDLFTREGYTLAGWSTEQNGGTTYEAGKPGVNLTDVDSKHVALYAQWTANTCTVEYKANGGTGTIEQGSFTYGQTYTLADSTLTYGDHKFLGWNTAADGTGTSYAAGQDITDWVKTHTGTLTLYAQWTHTQSVQILYEDECGNFSNGEKFELGEYKQGDEVSWSSENLTEKWDTEAKDKKWKPVDSVSYTVGSTDKVYEVKVYRRLYQLDVNGYNSKDSVSTGDINGQGLFDISVNSVKVSSGVYDYNTPQRYGTTFEITIVETKPGYTYKGWMNGTTIGGKQAKEEKTFTGTVTGKVHTKDAQKVETGVEAYYKESIYLWFEKDSTTTTDLATTTDPDTTTGTDTTEIDETIIDTYPAPAQDVPVAVSAVDLLPPATPETGERE